MTMILPFVPMTMILPFVKKQRENFRSPAIFFVALCYCPVRGWSSDH